MNVVSTALLTPIYLSFISLGLPDSVLGSAWPAMTVSLNAPLWGAGLIQMLISFCTIISSLNSARLIRKFGTGRLTAISVATTALALLGFSLAKNYVFLLVMAVPLGLGAGAVDAGLNNFVALHYEARHMSWLHCFWGVGATLGPVILSLFLGGKHGWRGGYGAVGLMQCAVSALLFATLGMWKRSDIQQEEREAKTLGVLDVLRLPGAKAGMMTFFGYCAVESTLGLWGATYISQVRGVSEGLENRLTAAVREADSLDDLYTRLKTKRYPHARLRRLVLDAALGFPAELPMPPYLHVLGARKAALPRLKQASLPAATALADLACTGSEAAKISRLHNKAVDFSSLCREKIQPMGLAFTAKPVVI